MDASIGGKVGVNRTANALVVTGPPEAVERAARLALRYQGQGVLAFDLAGAERGFGASRHARALSLVWDAGLALTLHAGEADVGLRVLEAAAHGATRIGHGVRLADAFAWREDERAALFDAVRAHDLHLEVCPTSNVHTGAFASLAEHPVMALWRAGLSLSFHTDNRLMSQITMGGEAEELQRACGATQAELAAMTLHAARRSFLPAAERQQAEARLRAWAGAAGVALPA